MIAVNSFFSPLRDTTRDTHVARNIHGYKFRTFATSVDARRKHVAARIIARPTNTCEEELFRFARSYNLTLFLFISIRLDPPPSFLPFLLFPLPRIFNLFLSSSRVLPWPKLPRPRPRGESSKDSEGEHCSNSEFGCAY